MPRPVRPRGSRAFDKPPLGLDALLDQLIDRGLEIPDRGRALRYLRHIGYYRLSPYAIPFQCGGPDHLLDRGTSFDDLLDLYVFDRSLRLVVMDALERVEIAVRAALTDHMSMTYGDPQWYTDSVHFRDRRRHSGLVELVRETCERRLRGAPETASDELLHGSALEHYLTTYGDPVLPPSWIVVETLTIGQLANAYANLQKRSDRTSIARSIGLTAPVLESWLATYVRVRNICAHHGRLWNVGLGVYPAIPSSPAIQWLTGDDPLPEGSRLRLYPVLVSLQSVLATLSPHSRWATRLHDILVARPAMNLRGMGVPSDWADDEFWRRRLHREATQDRPPARTTVRPPRSER